ncbi:MAG TPA: STAS domain-containing protein [Burkholderiales bacterium]|nr:STAS domain-containing protein [Burkholderiales bacterium]
MPLPHREYAGIRVVSPVGRLDHETCDAFQADLAPHVQASAHEGGALVLDLSRLEYISSAGLRCLMMAARQAGEQRGRILVAAMQPIVSEIVRISRFNLVLEVFASTREALAAVSPQAAQAFERG